MEKSKAVFFDRDGTLNVDTHYLYRIEEFQWMPQAVEAVRYCRKLGYRVIVITNQSGVAGGLCREEDVQKLHSWMNEELEKQGTRIDAFYYCPHKPGAPVRKYSVDCSCRKPKPGMVLQACEDFNIDKSASLMVGDSSRDVECAEAAGVRGYLYEGGSLLEFLKGLL